MGQRIIWKFRWLSAILFFFSSRRRHTRFDCDWSSDVCSSDLIEKINRIAASAYIKAALTLRDPRHFLFFNRTPDGKRAATDYMARLKERTGDRDKRISLQARRAQLKAIRAAEIGRAHV